MNLPKLKGKLKEKNKNYTSCANVLGISTATFCLKMNGKATFYIDELETLGNFLEMSESEKADIFLATPSHKWEE